MSLRWRVQVVGFSALLAGVVLPWVAAGGLTRARRLAAEVCGRSAATPGARPGTVCGQALLHSSAAVAVTAAVILLALVAVAGLGLHRAARWCLAPIRDLAGPISHVGPQNLGHRVRTADPDLAPVGEAIDAMMERIAAGYDGQRRFAANASHELRTPLAVQRTLIEVGLAVAPSPEQLELLTRQLLTTNERNERLIEGLLVLSESDQGLAGRTPQRLDEITAAVVAAHTVSAGAAGVTLTTALAPRTVPGEEVLLERLVTNLVQNAVKYNRPGGSVEVVVGAGPALTVVNTGPAVPAEAVAGLFEPFRRLAAERTDHSGGSGLGLTITRSIARAHDGVVRATPNPGGGLRVEVDLPGGA